MEQLARSMTGCDHALVSSHIKRGPDQAARHEDLAPISFVHSDFAPGYDELIKRAYSDGGGTGSRAVLERNGLTAADVQRARRMVILQFWRNIGPAKMDFPIAFCDARSISFDDGRAFLVSTTTPAVASTSRRWRSWRRASPPRSTGTRSPSCDRTRWSRSATYDSDLVREATTYFTPHSAFRDAEVEIGRPARQSIELRANCLFF